MNSQEREYNSADLKFSIFSGYSTYRDPATGNGYKLSDANPYKWTGPSTGRVISTPENIPPTWGNCQPMPRVG